MALKIRGADDMAATKAPANGVIRHPSGSARRISAGNPIPDGWTFDDGSAKTESKKKGGKKPAQNTKADGPSETS